MVENRSSTEEMKEEMHSAVALVKILEMEIYPFSDYRATWILISKRLNEIMSSNRVN